MGHGREENCVGGGGRFPEPPSLAAVHGTLSQPPTGRSQWVRFASPQLAPTASATTVFIALSSECHLVFIEFSVNCSSAGVWVQGPFLPLPQIGFAVACGAVGLQTFGQAHAVCLVDRRMGRSSTGSVAFMQVRGQQWEGICCCWPHSAMPSPALCLDLGPKGLVGSGNMQS